MEINIRPVRKEDASQLIEHTKIVLTESTFMLTTPEEFTLTVEEEEKWIEGHTKPGNLIIVADIEGKIIGNLNFQTSKRKRLSHLGYFGISIQEAYCNHGIGSKLLEYLLEWALKEPKLEKVCLEVFSHNKRAIHLYKKFGFKEEGRKVKYVKFSDRHYEDEIIMYKFVK
ncbi:GNAT family N-acetyltransferase [Fredinandcohnia sp. QZ13]|uniref:GNAT family N-acetyltransferase n=1 Tax=Fredinandcohnia sp. QZ13 TaxID=3073144 RepID=UPI0028532974|nr:GNAT family N-acetyltransferase [Fredinandcohnia sp. QZ13]MDR4887080.1 GNAT family N-acetyltransferase [Fredinandcohnia sp. QZ13]